MKPILPLLTLTWLVCPLPWSHAQWATGPAAYQSTQRGRDFTVWQREESEPNPLGGTRARVSSYVELETGKHYWDGKDWRETREEIEIVEKGAVAIHGPHQVSFAANIASPVGVEIQTPEGKRLKTRVLGLAYYDFEKRETVLIAELKDSVGRLVAPNQIVYPDAFTDVEADIRYTYRKGGLEQDVILRERPVLPEAYRFNPVSTRLLVLTEFIDPPADVRRVSEIRRGWTKATVDKIVDFGTMKIGPGMAFDLADDPDRSRGIAVQKHWQVLDGRAFLIEEVSMPKVTPLLRKLRANRLASTQPVPGSVLHVVSKQLLLPKAPLVRETAQTIQLAGLTPAREGFVVDFDLQNATDCTLEGDKTYYVSGTVNLGGTTTIEGGAVVKYAAGAQLNLLGPVDCQTGPYRPAIFTAKDDNSVGDTISGSTGTPSGRYANIALALGLGGDLKHLQIHHAREAIYCGNNNYTVSHAQLVKCDRGLHSETVYGFAGYNLLMVDVLTNFYGSSYEGRVEHLTVHKASRLTDDPDFHYEQWCDGWPSTYLTLVNSLTVCVTNGYGITPVAGDHLQNLTTDVGVFQTAGGGAHYLAADSAYRNTGTTSINPGLAEALKRTTTHPPIVYDGAVVSMDGTLGPQAPRNQGIPDWGYHYDPLDYLFGGSDVNADITFAPGTVVGWFRKTAGWQRAGHGIHIGDNKTLTFDGRVDQPCWWVHQTVAQEHRVGYSPASDGPGGISGWAEDVADTPVLNLRFTRCAGLPYGRNHFRDDYGVLRVNASHCEFYSGALGGYISTVGLTNCLLDRVSVWLEGGVADFFALRNCTMRDGKVWINRWPESWGGPGTGWVPVTLTDCAFDGTDIETVGQHNNDPAWSRYDYNAFKTGADTTAPAGDHDVEVASFNWQTSWLGGFYLPLGSDLIDAGSRSAADAGLYHFTTRTTQDKESTSPVDIGCHYVALDANGKPVDTDGDGIPDYLEDANGNGVQDGDEDPWELAILTQPANISVNAGDTATFSVLAGGTAPLTYQWKKNGVDLVNADNISGVQTPSLQITDVVPGDAGVYTVEVRNGSGAILSAPGALTVCHSAATSYRDVLLRPGSALLHGSSATTEIWFQFPEEKIIVGYELLVWDPIEAGEGPDGGICFRQPIPPAFCQIFACHPPEENSLISTVNSWSWAIRRDLPYLPRMRQEYNPFAPLWFQYPLIPGQAVASTAIASCDFTFRLVGPSQGNMHTAVLVVPIERIFTYEQGCDSPPIIVTQPGDQPTCSGSPVTFSVVASGSAPLLYQWRFNGSDIADATGSTFTIGSVGTGDLGSYSVLVANGFGAVESRRAALTFGVTPVVAVEAVADAQSPCTEGAFRISRSCDAGNLTVHYSVAGTAVNGTDYSTLNGTVVIPDGQLSTLVIVAPQTLEADKTVILTISASAGYSIGAAASASLAIIKDGPTIRLGFDTDAGVLRGNPGNDDDSSDEIGLGYEIRFGNSPPKSSLYVNNNGNVTFGSSLVTFTPNQLTEILQEEDLAGIIAPFWADVDTRNEACGLVRYGKQVISGRNAFGITWPNVGYYQMHSDKRNTFQLVLIDRSDISPGDFDMEFNYEKIRWETGDVDGSGGFGGYSAHAGFALGTEHYELPGSGVNGALLDSNPETGLKHHSLGTCKPGRYLFQFRGGRAVRLPPVNFDPPFASTLPVTVTLSVPGRPDSTIYYTLDGSIPTRANLRYTGPLTISANTQVRAIATEPGLADGPVASGIYGNAAPTPSGLVAWWSAESNMEDHTGRHNGNCLIPQVQSPAFTAGKVGQAFCFTPDCQRNGSPISVLDDRGLRLTKAVTVEGWVKIADASAERVIFARADGWYAAYALINRPTEPPDAGHATLAFQINSGPVWGGDEVTTTVSVGDWHYVVGVFDGPDASDPTLRLYVDPNPDGNGEIHPADEKTTVVEPYADLGAGTWVSIGANPDGTSGFNGLVDELAVYSRPLTDSEILWIYIAGANGKLTVPPSAPLPRVQIFGRREGGQWHDDPQYGIIYSEAEQGTRVDLAAFFEGTGLTYQWYRDEVLVAASDHPILSMDPVSRDDEGVYQVKASNGRGSASWWHYLRVFAPPIITEQPQDQAVHEGDTATLTVTASGKEPFWYEWYHWDELYQDWVCVNGDSEPALTLQNVQLEQAGGYFVVVYDADWIWVASSIATLTVTPDDPPAIVIQPQNQVAAIGGGATFTVTVTGTAPFTYQWRFNGGDIAGGTTSTMTLNDVQEADAGAYSVLVENHVGAATSVDALLQVVTPAAPTILSQPVARTAIVGADVVFSVQVVSPPPTTYQWRRNGNTIVGATGPSLVIQNVSPADSGSYSVVVQNPFGTTTSSDAALAVTVVPLPPVIISPLHTAGLPATVTLSAPLHPDAVIYYTLDGSAPTTSSSTYSGPLTISAKTTVSALAAKPNWLNSGFSVATIGDPDAPTAVPDTISIDQGAAAQLNVLANDTNPNAEMLTLTIMLQPQHGTVTPGNADVTYVPDGSGFFGLDFFTYTITDGLGNRSAATVSVFVDQADNSPPLSARVPLQRLETLTVTLPAGVLTTTFSVNDLLAAAFDPDGDPLVVYSISAPQKGTVIGTGGGQIQYVRDAAKFGIDEFRYVVADGHGGYDTGTIVISQTDSDGDGMPDDWEDANGLDPFTDDSTADPDSDGLSNLAEYALHRNPQVADNPLNLPPSLSMAGDYLDVSLSIPPQLDPGATFLVIVDGDPVEPGAGAQVACGTDGTWRLQLNPVFANGNHSVMLGFQYAAEAADSLQTAFGSPENLTVDSPFTLDPSSSSYDGGLYFEASVNVPASSFTIGIYDRHENLLTTLAGAVTDDRISASWDGTDGSGHSIASGRLTAVVNLAAPGGSAGSGSASVRYRECKCGKDVTRLVYTTLSDIAEFYRTAPWYRQVLAPLWMEMGGLWDILYLKAYEDGDIFERFTCQPCKDTVAFEGQCVSADELNYMMLGLGLTLRAVYTGNPDLLIDQYEIALRIRGWEWLLDEPEDVQTRKVGFALYAMRLYGHFPEYDIPVLGLAWPDVRCKIQKGKVAKRSKANSAAYPQNWRWTGLRNNPAPPPPFP